MAKRFEELEIVFKTKFPDAGKSIEVPTKEPLKELVEEPVKELTEEPVRELTAWEEEKVLDEKGCPKASKVFNVIFYLIFVLMVGCAIWFSSGVKDVQFYEVLTDSMQSVYPKGSLVVVADIKPSELEVGDDVVFLSKDGDFIVHRIAEIEEENEDTGGRAFVTKGVDTKLTDEDVVLASNVLGKANIGIPLLGKLLTWISNNMWIVIAIFAVLPLLIVCIRLLWKKKVKLHILVIVLVGLLCLANIGEVFAQREAAESDIEGATGDGQSEAEQSRSEEQSAEGATHSEEPTSEITTVPTAVPSVMETPPVQLTPMQEVEINQGPEDESTTDYLKKDNYPPGKVTRIDAGRGLMILILGLAGAKIIGNVAKGIEQYRDAKADDDGNTQDDKSQIE